MALSADTQWWVRADGDDANSGAFDATIAGAGTNYCDQAVAQETRTNLATLGAGSTTLTRPSAGWTSAMVGNSWYITGGTNFDPGVYMIVAFIDSENVTLDRSPTPSGAGSLGTGKLGGARLTLGSWMNSHLAAGNQVNIRGDGNDDPTAVSYAMGSFFQSGNYTRLKGYNGRPLITSADSTFGLIMYGSNMMMDHLAFKMLNQGDVGYGAINGGTIDLYDCIIDQNGIDKIGLAVQRAVNCTFKNTGSTASGTYPAISPAAYGGFYHRNFIKGWRGAGIKTTADNMATISHNIIAGCSIGIQLASSQYGQNVLGNTLYGNLSDGLRVDFTTYNLMVILRNLFVANGGYGINLSAGSPYQAYDRVIDWNAFYGNTSGARSAGFPVGAHDITLSGDPFTNAAADDFTLNSTAGAGLSLRNLAGKIGVL